MKFACPPLFHGGIKNLSVGLLIDFNLLKGTLHFFFTTRLIDMDVGQEDLSQAFALASIWILFLAFGDSAFIVPVVYTVSLAYQDAFHSGIYSTHASALGFLSAVNGFLLMAMGSLVGYPIVSASGKIPWPSALMKYHKMY